MTYPLVRGQRITGTGSAGTLPMAEEDCERAAERRAPLGFAAEPAQPPEGLHSEPRPATQVELRLRPGDQQLPEINGERCVQDLVIEDIERRRQLGIERYGTALQPFNGRDALRDLYEELIDAAMYARQKIEERGRAEVSDDDPLTFDTYQDLARTTAIYPGQGEFMGLAYAALGAAGEAGEIANKVKKLLRGDADLTAEVRYAIGKEIGGTLWYLAQVATELDESLDSIAVENLKILASRAERDVLKGSGDDR